eukprot:CAMPEP_0184310980 /NCGR_PEP_ID=MMETSP1049-20130417/37260_1 /TAXON_ID=77928 /ORGANISM="Proteomonas sulcata, Strain CCMP704" /LENGTH=40 /DNA_ID= /DNA_START= /DNA_END= /DNA_ORIENTATION=
MRRRSRGAEEQRCRGRGAAEAEAEAGRSSYLTGREDIGAK